MIFFKKKFQATEASFEILSIGLVTLAVTGLVISERME